MKQKPKPKVIRRKLSPAQLEKILYGYESKYGIKSEDFYAKYNRGELGDDRDYIKWAGYFVMAMRSRLKEHVAA